MAHLATFDGIEYRRFAPADEREMIALLGETFARRDPLALAMGLAAQEFEQFVELLARRAAEQGLTIVARDTETGELAGVLLTEDSAVGAPEGMERLSGKFEPIFDLLGQLESEYQGGQTPVAAGEAAHLYLLGVSEPYQGRGIGGRLVGQCVAHAAERGYRRAVTEATSRRSQGVFRRAGFVERVRGSYEGHRFEGRSFFGVIAEEGGPLLMDKELARGAGSAA